MKNPQRQDRELLLEAFNAGWQAALGIKITHPRVLAVMESCFEGWLLEATDEVEVFGLSFRRREELPELVQTRAPERSRVEEPAPVAAREEREPERRRGGSFSANPAT